MKTLKLGSKGPLVEKLQYLLIEFGISPVSISGVYDRKTADAVGAFQFINGLYDDQIVGSNTWKALGKVDQPYFDEGSQGGPPEMEIPSFIGTRKVQFDTFKNSYSNGLLRLDVADDIENVRNELNRYGAVLTSSGTGRNPNTIAGKNRSSKSFHIPHLAMDLFVGAAMSSVKTDPYICVKEEDRYWTIWARCTSDQVKDRTLHGWVHRKQGSIETTGRFINLTEIMQDNGLERIRMRLSYGIKNYGGAEWWHFQSEKYLIPNVSTLGKECLKVYSLARISNTPVWAHKDAVFKKDWF